MTTGISESVLEILNRYVDTDTVKLSLETDLKNTNLDSIAMVEIMFDLEEQFDISIPDPESMEDSFQTPGAIVDYIQKVITQKETVS